MKINPDIFFIDDKNINYKNNIFLISGNEETFVYEVQQKIEKNFLIWVILKRKCLKMLR